MRNLGVMAVRPIDGKGPAFPGIDREGLAAIGFSRIAGLAAGRRERAQERVGAGGMPRRIGHVQDVIDLAVRKPDLILPALQ